MKITLVHVLDKGRERETYLPPLGLGSIAATLRARCGMEEISIPEFTSGEEIRRLAPDLVGISCVSQNYDLARALAAELKTSCGVPIIVGGPHVSGLPSSLGPEFDIGVIGEGEETMAELVRLFEAGRPSPAALGRVAGIVYRDGGALVKTPPRPPVRPLDNLPRPARDLLRIGPFAHMVTSRGCPCRCTFCSSSKIWNGLRSHSAEYVFEEIRELAGRWGARRINLMDDLFPADGKRLHRIADLVEAEGLDRAVCFACHGRAEFINEEVCRDLRRMGVQAITFGFESGSQRVLAWLKKGAATVEGNMRAAALCRNAGMRVGGSFIIGSPGETRGEILETLDFIRKSGIIGGDVYVLTPYPGTEVWEYALRQGIVSEDMEWGRLACDDFAEHPGIVLDTAVSQAELVELYLMIRGELRRLLDANARFLYARDYPVRNLLSLRRLLRAARRPAKAVSFLGDLLSYRMMGKGLAGGPPPAASSRR